MENQIQIESFWTDKLSLTVKLIIAIKNNLLKLSDEL